MDSGSDGGGRAKKRRVDVQEEAAAASVDHILELPKELWYLILTCLSLKEAIRTGALAREWRDLWRDRWTDSSSVNRSSVKIHLCSRSLQKELDALGQEPRPRRRLDRLSLIVDTCKLSSSELRRFIDYAAECRVEDLHVETRKSTAADKLNFHLPLSSPILARLSLRRISISNMYYKGTQPFHALEVIRLHYVSFTEAAFRKMIALCPSLRTLDLRGCHCGRIFSRDRCVDMPVNLRSVTIAECEVTPEVNLVPAPGLRSYLYRGSFFKTLISLPGNAMLADLYICLDESMSGDNLIYCTKGFNKVLPDDLSGLTVLTICSNALPAAQSPKLSNLHSLRELQLLMLKMEANNLADIYVFLKTCQCPNLERFFVQLPELDDKPMAGSLDEVGEEPPENGLDNLKIVKAMNFDWRRTEVQLVSFLLRKATSLNKLLLVSRNLAPLDMPDVQEADLLLLKEALANGKIMFSDSDDAATQPYHKLFFEI